MQAAIGYLRISTREQGRCGLGLAAQRFDIEAFGVREGFSVRSWHQAVFDDSPEVICHAVVPYLTGEGSWYLPAAETVPL